MPSDAGPNRLPWNSGRLRFVPMLRTASDGVDAFVVALVKLYSEEGVEFAEHKAWAKEFPSKLQAAELYVWMASRPERWIAWGRIAPILGADMFYELIVEEARRSVSNP